MVKIIINSMERRDNMNTVADFIVLTEDSGTLLGETKEIKEEWEKAVVEAFKYRQPIIPKVLDGVVICPKCGEIMSWHNYTAHSNPHCINCGQALMPYKSEDHKTYYTEEELLNIDTLT